MTDILKLIRWHEPSDEWQPSPSYEDLELHPSGRVRPRPHSYAPKFHCRNDMYGHLVIQGTGRRGQIQVTPLGVEMLHIWPKPKPLDKVYQGSGLQPAYYDGDPNHCDIANLYWTTDENLYKLSELHVRNSISHPIRLRGLESKMVSVIPSILEASKQFGLDPIDVLSLGANKREYHGFLWETDF